MSSLNSFKTDIELLYSVKFAARYDSVLQQFNDSVKMCQEQKSLIGQLEDDLRKVNALSVMFRGDAEVDVFLHWLMLFGFNSS